MYKLKDRKTQYHELLRAYFHQQQEEEILTQCTFQPKINPSSQCRFYFNESGQDSQYVKKKADVIKRNELWKECKEKKLKALKKEQEMQFKDQCTFTPHMPRSRSSIGFRSRDSNRGTPNKINHKAVDKFIHRQELAR